MAPVAATLLALLAVSGLGEAKPLSPGRHAPPRIANILSTSRRSLHSLLARYYGDAHGLTKPAPLPTKRDTSIPAGWSYFGCVDESWDERLLSGFGFSSESLTPLLCLTECSKLGYTYGGMEYADECYCGDGFTGDGGGLNSASTCNMACSGDSSAMCGAGWYLSLYTYNDTGLASCDPSTAVTTTLSAGSGVATGGLNASQSVSVSASITASATASVNASASISLSASSSASISANASASVSVTASSSAASASSTFVTYEDAEDSSEWYSLGCAVDSSTRVLTGSSSLSIQNLTIDDCLTSCEEAGYTYAGLEYGEQCYCGSSLPSSVSFTATCDMACTGDASETCGGGWGLAVYELVGISCETTTSTIGGNHVVIPSTSVAASASATSSSSSAVIVVPTAVSSVATSSEADVSSAAVSVAASATVATTTSAAAASATAAVTASSTAAPESTTVPSSSSDHQVWAHHMVGNTYPYAESDWESDIQAAQSYGIDGFALNIGSESWQVDRAADAYSAAAALGTGFKLFISLDMTSLSCASSSDADNLVSIVTRFATQSNQATHDSKVLVSTFAGSDCQFGTGSSSSWQSSFVDRLGFDIFFVPSLFSDISTFSSDSWMDGELNWNSGWPSGDADITTTSTDAKYIAALGDKEYMPAVSPFFFTHFGANSWNKNWLYRGDDWLYCSRWEQIIALRDSVSMTEILTWNDFGESSYLGPIHGALPSGSDAWVDGFDHTGINVLTKYYATAFKTGSYPAIETDTIIMWSRPHAHDATASDDSVGKPTGWDWTEDYLYAVVLATSPAVVSLTSGDETTTFAVSAGLSKLKVASNSGTINGRIIRDGSVVTSYYAYNDFDYTQSPSTYNYNYFVGSSSS
ncbi:glycosyl hydrolase family 71-domain-containing protein [Naematelia encephala]|uniref:Glycosyl hydrolase family 71-domain-containing protein n=1 Tax=Naematelia encephala TaxID=71784 RepID=A0A1Y2ATC4_9TREE|nr:glycosyl hydrolase family 71-domain-containing protein [Naematelia encephala]